MKFENLIDIIKFLETHLELVKEIRNNPLIIKADIKNNELIIEVDYVTYTSLKYKVIYCNIKHNIEVSGKENRDLLNSCTKSLYDKVKKYSKLKLLNDISSYEDNCSDIAINCNV